MTFVRLDTRILQRSVVRQLVATACGAAIVAVAAAPSLAQRGRGIPGLGRSGLGSNEPEVSAPKQVNAVNLLIEHRPELALSDTQFMRVIAIKRTLDSTNAPLMRRLDSVQRLFKRGPLFSQGSTQRRDSLTEARSLVRDVTAAVRENNATGRDQAYALLSAKQLDTAHSLEAAAEQRIADESQRGRGQDRGGKPPSG
jgi:hypothetical protein